MRFPALVSLLFCWLLATPSRAEFWPTLPQYVDQCVLIVLCKTEGYEGGYRHKVEETWKGVYSPELFYHKPDEGYLYTGSWHGNEDQKEGGMTVFFFTPNSPTWTKGKLLDHSTAFQIKDGKLTYAATGGTWVAKEYAVPDFRKEITERVRQTFAAELENRIKSSQ